MLGFYQKAALLAVVAPFVTAVEPESDVASALAAFEQRVVDAERKLVEFQSKHEAELSALEARLREEYQDGADDMDLEEDLLSFAEGAGPRRLNEVRRVNKNLKKLRKRVRKLERKFDVVEAKVICITDDSDSSLVNFEGCNVQITNGDDKTTTTNSYGNLLLGYNSKEGCVDGCKRSGSHNIVVGDGNSWGSYGGVVFGEGNTILGNFASVVGGKQNVASGNYGSVLGGTANYAIGGSSAVSGGRDNYAKATHASVSGGKSNLASGSSSSILGGEKNVAAGTSSAVAGGFKEKAKKKQQVIPKP